MKIKAIYPHHVGYVDSSELDSLIKKGKIMAFVRAHKLVFVGIHPIRKASTTTYHPDTDRRKNHVT